MSSKEDDTTKDATMANDADDDDQSDVEMEGMDMEGIEEEEEEEDEKQSNNDDNEVVDMAETKSAEENDEALAKEEAEEMEEARRERLELLEYERKKAAEGDVPVDPQAKFEYLIQQSDVFAHFLAGESLREEWSWCYSLDFLGSISCPFSSPTLLSPMQMKFLLLPPSQKLLPKPFAMQTQVCGKKT